MVANGIFTIYEALPEIFNVKQIPFPKLTNLQSTNPFNHLQRLESFAEPL